MNKVTHNSIERSHGFRGMGAPPMFFGGPRFLHKSHRDYKGHRDGRELLSLFSSVLFVASVFSVIALRVAL